jgi:hypothetical protein
METNWTEIAGELNFAIKNYIGLTKQIVQIMNRAHAYGIDPTHEELIVGKIAKDGSPKMQGLKSLKGVAGRRIERVLKDMPIWDEWLTNVPGVGPAIGGQLVALYYFKSIPVCPKCEADLEDFKCPVCKGDVKGQGVLKYRIELRDFPTISSWWHFMGRHIEDGKMPKRRKMKEGDEVNPNRWSSSGRKLGYDFKESINKLKGNKYKEFAEKRKRYRERTHPDATKGHRHNMAWNESWKLFLSHFWQVDHILSGAEMTEPWCVQHGGHDKATQIPPYYFNGF